MQPHHTTNQARHKTKRELKQKALSDAMKEELARLEFIVPPAKGKLLTSRWLTYRLNRVRRWLAKRFDAAVKKAAEQEAGAEPPTLPDLVPAEQRLIDAFDDCREAHGPLSTHYSEQYKGSYLLNYALAVLAVGLAVISLGLLYFSVLTTNEHARHILQSIAWGLGVVKLLFLVVIAANTKQAEHLAFNDRAIAYRYLKEQLRCMYYLPLFGLYQVPGPSGASFVKRQLEDNPVEQHFRKVAAGAIATALAATQNAAPEEQTADAPHGPRLPALLEYVRIEWVHKQADYHQGNERKHELLDERLEKRVNILNLFVLVIVALDVLWGVDHFSHWLPHGLSHVLHAFGTPLILITATIIPVRVAALNALRFQTEARRLAERSGYMMETLEHLNDQEFPELIRKAKAAGADADHNDALRQAAEKLLTTTAQTMIDEVADWTFVYSNSVFEA